MVLTAWPCAANIRQGCDQLAQLHVAPAHQLLMADLPGWFFVTYVHGYGYCPWTAVKLTDPQ